MCIGLSACTAAEQDAAVEAADAFTRAVTAGDAATACEQLAPVTRIELERSAATSCEQAVLTEAVPAGTRLGADTYGSMAQVRYADDVVFVSRFPDAWRVIAAACTAQPGAPYDCRISGR
jgi:hypothetical protein